MQNFQSDLIEKKIGYKFKDKSILLGAFIHSSYANENRSVKSNERLEFLGDSVLSLIVTDYVYSHFKNGEGDLSKIRASLVNEKTLSFIFEQLELDQFIVKGRGLINSKPTPAMMADAFEALTASIYIDGGYDKANKFVLRVLTSALESLNKTGVPESNKSLLQEKFKTAKIVYQTRFEGEGEKKIYFAKVLINGAVCGEGSSGKKREAEELSAKMALKNVKKV